MTYNLKQTNNQRWLKIPWTSLQRQTYRIQKRIYYASRNEDVAQIIQLQQRLLYSYPARILAIRQVTEFNQSKRVAGIDGKSILTYTERFQLEKKLAKKIEQWEHQELRQISISQLNKEVKIVKIPTIEDLVWQHLIKMILEPAYEAIFHERNYGFRPGRSPQDAQKSLFLHLNRYNKGEEKKILELKIDKVFDKIHPNKILENLIAPQCVKKSLYLCFKQKICPDFSEQNIEQGNIISPLLANILLNGIESIHTSIRYANTILFILTLKDNEKQLLKKIDHFLIQRGMTLKNQTINIIPATQGFDF